MIRALLHAILLAALPMATAAQALIEWKGDERYEKKHTVAPGKFAELCTRLGTGAGVKWAFAADAPLDFNIHYHVGNRIEYPAKADGSRRESGTLVAASVQHYCWMWSNRGASPVAVKVDLAPRRSFGH